MLKSLLLMLPLMLLPACRTPNVTPSANVDSLIRRPDFEAARLAAPEWCRATLYIIKDQGREIKELKVQLQEKE